MIEFAVWVYFGFRSLLCRPLPVDIGRCTCVIVKEASPEGLNGGTLYSLYTNVSSLLFMSTGFIASGHVCGCDFEDYTIFFW